MQQIPSNKSQNRSAGQRAEETVGIDVPEAMLLENPLSDPAESVGSMKEIDGPQSLAERVKLLTESVDQRTFQLLCLLPAFDRQRAWAVDGHRSCISWLNACCGMSPSAATDRRRVAYALEQLPVIRQLFQCGELSWSKVRALTRIATAANERDLVARAMTMSASEIERSVRQFRDVNSDEDVKDEDERSKRQYQRRQVSVYHDDDGMVRIYSSLPPLEGAAVLQSMARAEDEVFDETGLEALEDVQVTATQRRADAMFRMAMAHMSGESADIKVADRYQVVVHVDAATLHQSQHNPDPSCGCRSDKPAAHPLRCHIEGGSAVAASTARRLADDCSVLAVIESDGEPLSIGRKNRVWPQAISRAIRLRDTHCQFPGCDATRHLQLHHMKHWIDGGETSVENGVALCGHHHRLVHERRYTVERTPLAADGKRSTKTIQVATAAGDTIAMTTKKRRFRVRRVDGSIFGE